MNFEEHVEKSLDCLEHALRRNGDVSGSPSKDEKEVKRIEEKMSIALDNT